MNVSDLIKKSRDQVSLTKDELIYMFGVAPDSPESYQIMAELNRISRELTEITRQKFMSSFPWIYPLVQATVNFVHLLQSIIFFKKKRKSQWRKLSKMNSSLKKTVPMRFF